MQRTNSILTYHFAPFCFKSCGKSIGNTPFLTGEISPNADRDDDVTGSCNIGGHPSLLSR